MNAMPAAIQKPQAQEAGPATPEQIRELPRKYAIGKRPLSRLLGWGELTYTRLLDGGVPNAAHSDEIRRLLDDPAAFARLLEISRERKTITGVAYDRSRRAVDALLSEAGHDATNDALKIFAVADRICALTSGDITPRTLQKLMHAAQEKAIANGTGALLEQEAIAVDWGFEYPQIASGYSFDAIQAVAARLQGSVVMSADDSDAISGTETESEETPAPEAESEPSKKKGKKSKKGKKEKGKAKKKGKKGKGGEADSVVPAEPSGKPEPAGERGGLLSPAECRIIDTVVARYQKSLAEAFA